MEGGGGGGGGNIFTERSSPNFVTQNTPIYNGEAYTFEKVVQYFQIKREKIVSKV